MNPGLIKTLTAGAAIAARRIVTFDHDGDVVAAATADDALIGVADALGAPAAGARVDVQLAGLVEVVFGDAVAAGALVTSDTTGRGIPAIEGDRVIGWAFDGGVAGDVARVMLAQGAVAGRTARTITVPNADLTGASAATLRVAAPVAGRLSRIVAVLQGALTTGDATISASIGATPVTGGVVTLAQAGSAGGTTASAVPSAANAVTAWTSVVTLTVGGVNTAAVGAVVHLDFTEE